jgi:hypothetical protein
MAESGSLPLGLTLCMGLHVSIFACSWLDGRLGFVLDFMNLKAPATKRIRAGKKVTGGSEFDVVPRKAAIE